MAIGPEPDETPAAVRRHRPSAPTPRVADGPRRPRRWRGVLAVGIVAGVMLARRGRARRRATVAARGALMPTDRQPGLVHRPPVGRGAARTRSAARSRTRPSTPATCSTCPRPCGTPGPRTTTPPAATWSPRSTRPATWPPPANEAMSYAAYRLLTSRYIAAVGADVSLSEFADLMDSLCYSLDVTTSEGDTPAAVGNRIADAVLAAAATDGSNEYGGYAATDYAPVNAPMIVADPGTTMTDPNRWQPLKIANLVSQNGIPVANGLQQALGPHWGHVDGVCAAAGRGRRHADRPRTAAPAGRSRDRCGAQGAGPGGDPAQQPARPGRRRDDRHLARRDGRQPAGHQRRHRARRQPGHRPAIPAERRGPGRLRARAGRVLGRRAKLGDAAGPLERDRQLGVGCAGPGPPGRRHRPRGGPARVGHQALPRAQRRGPRRGDRGLGPQGSLRFRASDLADPVHGRQGPVERPVPARLRPGGPSARAGPRRGHHERHRRRPDSATRRSRGTRARSRSAPGRPTPRTRRPTPPASAGAWRRSGSRTR